MTDLDHMAGMAIHNLSGSTAEIVCLASDPVMHRRIKPEAESIREARDRLTYALSLLEKQEAEAA